MYRLEETAERAGTIGLYSAAAGAGAGASDILTFDMWMGPSRFMMRPLSPSFIGFICHSGGRSEARRMSRAWLVGATVSTASEGSGVRPGGCDARAWTAC